MRAFVAIDIAETVQSALVEAAEAIAQTTRGIRWVTKENLHLTLKFLGKIDPSHLRGATKMLQEAAARVEPFRIGVQGIGTLPRGSRPRIVYAGIASCSRLLELAKIVDPAFEGLGILPDSRPFHAHITLGRLRTEKRRSGGPKMRPEDRAELIRKIQGFAGVEFGTVTVDRIVLYESRLDPNGPKYTARALAPLSTG